MSRVPKMSFDRSALPRSPSQIGAAYDLLAERWLDGRFPADNGVVQHQRALAFLNSSAAGYALQVGCGCNTRFHRLFHDRGLLLEGFDVSERMVAMARAAAPDVPVHHADIGDWEPLRQYCCIAAWDSLWHVALSQQRAVLLKLMAALEPGGCFLFTAGGLEAPAEHRDASMGPELYYASLGIPALCDVIREGGCVCLHLEFDQHPETHLSVIVRRCG